MGSVLGMDRAAYPRTITGKYCPISLFAVFEGLLSVSFPIEIRDDMCMCPDDVYTLAIILFSTFELGPIFRTPCIFAMCISIIV